MCEKCGGPLSVHSEEAERIVEQEKRSQPKVPYLLCFLMPLLGAYYELKAGLEGDLAEKTAIRIASGAGTVVWVLLILAACWIAGAFSPNPDAQEAEAAMESFFTGCIRPFL